MSDISNVIRGKNSTPKINITLLPVEGCRFLFIMVMIMKTIVIDLLTVSVLRLLFLVAVVVKLSM